MNDPEESMGNVWLASLCLQREHQGIVKQVDFCARGYLFVVVALMSLVLLVISGYCLARLHKACPRTHTHRKLLFGLLIAVAVIRGMYAAVAAVKIGGITTVASAAPVMQFLMYSLIPVNALSDLLTAAVDFLLTFFWLTVLGSRFIELAAARIVPVAAMAIFTIIGFVCFAVDYHILETQRLNVNIYQCTLVYIAVLLFCSAFLHFVTVSMLLRRLYGMHQQSELSPELRRHFLRVSIIGTVSTMCWAFRGMILMGRASNDSHFVQGDLSFNNVSFTFAYFTLFMNVPCCVVALTFLQLSLELFRRQNENEVVVLVGASDRSRRYHLDSVVRVSRVPDGGGGKEAVPLIMRQSARVVVHHTLAEPNQQTDDPPTARAPAGSDDGGASFGHSENSSKAYRALNDSSVNSSARSDGE